MLYLIDPQPYGSGFPMNVKSYSRDPEFLFRDSPNPGTRATSPSAPLGLPFTIFPPTQHGLFAKQGPVWYASIAFCQESNRCDRTAHSTVDSLAESQCKTGHVIKRKPRGRRAAGPARAAIGGLRFPPMEGLSKTLRDRKSPPRLPGAAGPSDSSCL